ncbi:lysozyme inhibitor LprI family protein [Enterobacter ludwigii]|uniref:lysozyme inhibitor LprI family protein n=1 Tax=Enterobacter ludwigii TaxID=299767 RepID=UPI0013D4D3F4|nr:hypothetical protein [Enterobacter ludwigii]
MKKFPFLPFFLGLYCIVGHAASFDCTKAKSYSEKLICSTPDISRMDDELKLTWDNAKANYPDKALFKNITRSLWNERETCSTEQCVRNWYTKALKTYSMLSGGNAASSADVYETKTESSGTSSAEDAFINVVTDAQRESKNAKNDMARGGIKSERDDKICSIIADGNVQHWRGKIDTLDANSDGNGVLGIELADGVIVKTWNNSISDSDDNTLIDPHSSLFKSVSRMSVGDNIRFSGQFVKDSGSCIKEGSLSLVGGLSEPEFIFKFSNVIKVSENVEGSQNALVNATPQQIKKARDILDSEVGYLSKVCVLIGSGNDDTAKDVINSMTFPDGRKNDMKINQEQFEGIKNYFLQYRTLSKENCDGYAGSFMKMIYSQNQ